LAYSPNTISTVFYKQAEVTTAIDGTLMVVHIFRMPVFYAMAGFFTALLLQRNNFWRAVKNRFWRIVVPLVVGWICLFPLVVLLVGTAQYGFDQTVRAILSGQVLKYAHPLHLWFLEYLIVLYLLAAIVVVVLPALFPEHVRALLLRLFRSAVQSLLAPLLFAVPSFLAMLQMKTPWLETPPSFEPVLRIVIAYSIPFAFGWLLFLNPDLLWTLKRRAWLYTVFAVIASLAYLASLVVPMNLHVSFYVGRAGHSLALWLFIFGITGLFLRYLGGHSALWRYLCDSSYFLFIAHPPVIIAVQALLKDAPLPPLVKLALVFISTLVVLMPLYHYCVRATFIGVALNGRKYPIAHTPAVACRFASEYVASCLMRLQRRTQVS